MRGLLPGLLVAGALAASGGLAHAARPAEEVRKQVEEVLSDPRYQRTRPEGQHQPRQLPPYEPRLPREPVRFEPSAATGVSEALLWVLGGVMALALVAVLTREGVRFARRTKRKKAKQAQAGALVDRSLAAAQALPASLEAARRLAAEGRYEEAVHVLLRGALDYLRALSDFTLEPAYTSREVLSRAPLARELRPAFADLVGTVEISLFGGLPVGAEDFGRCERSFLVLHARIGHDA